MLYCIECDYQNEDSLVEHINKHHGTVKEYLLKYPNGKVVTKEIFGELVSLSTTQKNIAVPKTVAPPTVIIPVKSKDKLVPEVDPNYKFHKENTDDINLALKNRDNIFITGPTGSGKTSGITQIAAKLNWAMQRVNCSNGLSTSDFVGRWIAKNGETHFQKGVLPQAMEKGHILLLDEISAADAGVLLVLQAVLEPKGKLTLTENDGEIITPHANFRIVCTDNTRGWDAGHNSAYQGRNALDMSLLDRFAVVIHQDYMPEKDEIDLLSAVTGVTRNIAKAVVKTASAVRDSFARDELPMTFSTRKSLAFCKYFKQTGSAKTASRICILNKLDRESSRVVSEIMELNFGNLMV